MSHTSLRNRPSTPSTAETGGEWLTDHAAALGQEAADTVVQLLSDWRARAQVRFEEQRDLAADTLERLSRALDFVGAEGQRHDEGMAHRFESASDRVHRIASYVSSSSPGSLTQDTKLLVRSRPGPVVAGSFLAGLILGRFLRASQKTDSARFASGGTPARQVQATAKKGDSS